MSLRSRRWIIKRHFSGLPEKEDLEFLEEELPILKEEEFLCEALWLSVDPYMWRASKRRQLGTTMLGEQVAKVIQSKNAKYAVGDIVTAKFGWTTHAICDDAKAQEMKVVKVDNSVVPVDKLSYALGVLGMPGATAYFALHNFCKPVEGETLVVNAAGGAVGSLVGQMAKIRGCRVVGFAGSDAKVDYMRSLGFDAAFNYKEVQLKEALGEACPEGIDMFQDHVGGEFHATVLKSMKKFGRVVVVGAMSEYDSDEKNIGSLCLPILTKQITISGFSVFDWSKDWPSAFKEIRAWIDEGKLKVKETVTDGIENMFDAFVGLFTGKNIGKAIVKP